MSTTPLPGAATQSTLVSLAGAGLAVVGLVVLLSASAPAVSVADGGTGTPLSANGTAPPTVDGTAMPSVGGNATLGTNDSGSHSGDPRILELYPNPTTEGNRGEYLVVSLPERGNWSLSDGYHDVSIPENVSGTVALSMDPASTAAFLDDGGTDVATDARAPVDLRALDGYFPLSASGDRIELRRGGDAVDVVDYGRVREGYRWRADWEEWRPRGYEPRPPERTENATVTPFVLPDTPEPADAPLRDADERLLLAGYTIESERVADRLAAAAGRGVTVRVLVEGSPVGGFSARSAELLDRLVAAGVEVRVLDGEPDRFRFHHAKYAVADDRAVVLTENWKPSGTGGRSNRGWGVLADSPPVADDLAGVFDGDATARDARDWESFRADASFYESGVANETYPTRFDPPEPTGADVELLTAPGNAADRIVARIDVADDRVLGVVPRTAGSDERIVSALRRAADRGVDVNLLLSGAWYDREENRELATALADEPIDVAVAEPRGRYGKIHAKGLVVDDAAIVGSLNWNEVATTENREVLLAIEDESTAAFYARTYAADWRGGGVHLPVGLLGGAAVVVVGASAVARREVQLS